MDFFYILSQSCNSHTHFSANDEKKLFTNLERPSPNFPLQPPTQSFILPVQVHPKFSHFVPSLKATRIPRHLNFSHFMHLPKPQKPFWPASVSMLSHIPWLVNFFVCSKLLSCAKCAPNFSRFLIYLCLLEITHIICKLHLYWCWLWRVWWPNCTSCQW